MRHLTGPLARLTARPTDTEDYIWATLTDPTPLPDAMAQLRAAYPNAMRLDYLPQGEVAHPLDMTQAVRGKPFVELFQDFFTKMNGRPLTVEETVAVKRLREEASKSDETPKADPDRLRPLRGPHRAGLFGVRRQRTVSDRRRHRRGQDRPV